MKRFICWLFGHKWDQPWLPDNTYCRRCLKTTGNFVGVFRFNVKTSKAIPKGTMIMMSPSLVVLTAEDAALCEQKKIGVIDEKLVNGNYVVAIGNIGSSPATKQVKNR